MSLDAADLCQALQQVLEDHLPAMLTTVETEKGLAPGALPPPRSWARLGEFAKLGDHQSPTIVIVADGMDPAPVSDYGLRWDASWRLRAVVVIRGRGYAETADRVKRYTAAVARTVLAHGRLGGIAESTAPGPEVYAEISTDQARSIAAGSAGFVVRTLGTRTGAKAD